MAHRVEGALLVHRNDGVVVRLVHLDDGPIAHNPGVVHHDVDRAEIVDRRPDDPSGALEVAHGVVTRDGVAAGRLDLLAHLGGGVLLGARTAEGHADIVDHDVGAFRSQAERDIPADAPPRTRHNCRTSVQESHGPESTRSHNPLP